MPSAHTSSTQSTGARSARWKYALALAVTCLIVGHAQVARAESTTPALADDLLVTRWSTDDGLPLDHLNALAVAADGALWIATYDGLVRFDGLGFHVARRADDPRLPNNRFTDLAASQSGVLWARSESGELVRISGQDIETYGQAGVMPPVSRLFRHRGALWALSAHGLIDLEQREPRAYEVALDGPLTSAARAADGVTWATDATGLHRVAPDGHRTQVIAAAGLVILEAYGRGDLWVGGTGLYRVELGAGERVTDLRKPGGVGFDAACAVIAVPGAVPAFEVRDRLGWWRLEGAGAALVHAAEVAFCDPVFEVVWPWRIAGRDVLRGDEVVYTAKEPLAALLPSTGGAVWVATRGEGLLRIHPRSARTLPHPASWSRPSVDAVHVDRNRAVWVVSLSDGLARLDPPMTVAFPNAGEKAPLVLGLVEHADGRLEVGTDRSLCTLAPGSSRCEPSPPRGGPREVLAPLAIVQRGAVETTYFGGLGPWVRGAGALWVRDFDGTERWRELRLGDGTPIRFARAVATAGPTTYVATADQGLLVIDGREGPGERVRQLTTRDGLSTDRLRNLHVDALQRLWIGTEDGGLCRYRPSDHHLGCLGMADGLHDDVIHAVVQDGMGRLWLPGNRGLSWVRIDTVEEVLAGIAQDVLAVKLDERDGMPHREGNGVLSQVVSHDGRLFYAATQGGVATVDPSLVPLVDPPSVTLESASTSRGGADVGELEVDASEALRLTWSAPQFAHSDDLRFRYRLGAGWSMSTREPAASWAALPPGRSTIEVQAGIGGQWGATLKVAVSRRPRFAETLWFPVAVGASVTV